MIEVQGGGGEQKKRHVMIGIVVSEGSRLCKSTRAGIKLGHLVNRKRINVAGMGDSENKTVARPEGPCRPG